MEDKKGYKIGLMPLILLILNIILIIVIIVMGFIIHNKNQENAKGNSLNGAVITNIVSNSTIEKPEPTNKIDDVFENIIAGSIQNAVAAATNSTENVTTIDASTKDEYAGKMLRIALIFMMHNIQQKI